MFDALRKHFPVSDFRGIAWMTTRRVPAFSGYQIIWRHPTWNGLLHTRTGHPYDEDLAVGLSHAHADIGNWNRLRPRTP